MPHVAVPTRRHSGLAADGSLSLFGSSEPFASSTLERLYPDRATYATALEEATARAVEAAVLLKEDAAEERDPASEDAADQEDWLRRQLERLR